MFKINSLLKEIDKIALTKQYEFINASLVEKIDPISSEIKKLKNDKSFLDKILSEGQIKANDFASKKLKKMQEIVGF